MWLLLRSAAAVSGANSVDYVSPAPPVDLNYQTKLAAVFSFADHATPRMKTVADHPSPRRLHPVDTVAALAVPQSIQQTADDLSQMGWEKTNGKWFHGPPLSRCLVGVTIAGTGQLKIIYTNNILFIYPQYTASSTN